MATFEYLWDHSAQFRRLFVGKHGVLGEHTKPVEIAKAQGAAKASWEGRYPLFEWGLCRHRGCTEIVPDDKDQGPPYCNKHGDDGLVKWSWQNGELYRLYYREYRPWARHTATNRFGEIPAGFEVCFRNGNRLDHRHDNIFVISQISKYLVDRGLMLLHQAVELDRMAGELFSRSFQLGKSPEAAVFGVGDIAKAASVSYDTAKAALDKGKYDISSLPSIVGYIEGRRTPKRYIDVERER